MLIEKKDEQKLKMQQSSRTPNRRYYKATDTDWLSPNLNGEMVGYITQYLPFFSLLQEH